MLKVLFRNSFLPVQGPMAPYNEGYGVNLSYKRETKKEKVPLLGYRAPLKIEQDHYTGDRLTKIAFTTPQTRSGSIWNAICR